MRHIKYIYAIFLLFLFITVSCEQFRDVSNIKEVESLSAKINISFDLQGAPMPDEVKVRLTNFTERYELGVAVSPEGDIKVDNIIPGIYTVTVSAEKNEDGFTYNYNGNAVNVNIVTNDKQIDVKVGASRAGALVFKEVFYCGSKTPSGGSYFRDQFYEIYNNSEIEQNVRGLAIGYLNPNTATANLPVWPGPDADKYVYASNIWQIPDTADFPLNPGESIIIAQMADDHKKSNLNPSSPVNLLSAEFEGLVKTTALIQDNPAINMSMAFWPSPLPQWLTTVFGGAFVIFYPPGPIDPNSPTETVSPEGSTAKSYRIPIEVVIDALENVGNPNQMQLKRVPAMLDAGAATVNGTYLSKSVARKVKETLPDGRVILQDTNNSTDDFEVMDPPVIRRYDVKVPSWNTWK
ncbi:DUF4876 domain-containing protein [Proteiniphilum sp. UBA5384]|uniref:DUF4876 domain-containing protein n=1 Tax=Proteiniphilum sp. UBA5384 TaxID=1947279 RepID=UPI0025CE2695|nr:DUF4876 domain-containing protein [Proteiniphilum sp. UBA5384]